MKKICKEEAVNYFLEHVFNDPKAMSESEISPDGLFAFIYYDDPLGISVLSKCVLCKEDNGRIIVANKEDGYYYL